MSIGEIVLESPLINAGGLVRTPEDVRRMAAAPVSAVFGSSSPLDYRAGNSPNGEVVYYHDPVTGITYNAMGIPGKGVKNLVSSGELQQMIRISHDLGKPFIFGFAPVSQDPVEEMWDMFGVLIRADIRPDGIEIDAGCPTLLVEKDGQKGTMSHLPELLKEVLDVLVECSSRHTDSASLVRIAPFRDKTEVAPMVRLLKIARVDAVSAFNTFSGENPRDKEGKKILDESIETCGLSGPGMAPQAEEQTRWLMGAREENDAHFAVIGSTGISNGESMKRRMDMGVTAVSATTAFYESSDWGYAATNLLEEYANL